MFRRLWSGLPMEEEDYLPCDLTDLGYYVNDKDEIRSILNPSLYFNFTPNHNERVNLRHRFNFNRAVERIVYRRLVARGLREIKLPMRNGGDDDPRHVPVLADVDLESRHRVVVILGEPSHDLGILSYSVLRGPGGINQGSMVAVVDALNAQASSKDEPSPPGVILANPGQLYWWPEGGRPLTTADAAAIPLPSSVHYGRRHVPALHSIPRQEDAAGHVQCLFDELVAHKVNPEASISIVAIGECCEIACRFFDHALNWETWGPRLSSMVLMGNVYPDDGLANKSFKRFLARRACSYLVSDEPLDTPLASPSGSTSNGITNTGTPCYSSSEPIHIESTLVRALGPALAYLEVAAFAPDFENPTVAVSPRQDTSQDAEVDWQSW